MGETPLVSPFIAGSGGGGGIRHYTCRGQFSLSIFTWGSKDWTQVNRLTW